MCLVYFLPPDPTTLQTVTQRGIPAHLHPYSLLLHLHPLQVPEMDLLSPKLPSYPQHTTAISRSNCRVWAARGKREL